MSNKPNKASAVCLAKFGKEIDPECSANLVEFKPKKWIENEVKVVIQAASSKNSGEKVGVLN